jgi:calmodulin
MLFQISAIHEAFSYFDNNNDGLICKTEFSKILTSFGEFVTESEIVSKIREWDEDGDGSINFAEFIGAMTQILTDTESEERMREAFRFFDKVFQLNKKDSEQLKLLIGYPDC